MDTRDLDANYAAYARCDQYGPMACSVPRVEKLKLLCVWLTLLPLLRAAVCVLCILVFYLCCLLCSALPQRVGNALLLPASRACCRTVLLCCGVWRLKTNYVAGCADGRDATTAVYVANHVSWLDILIAMEQRYPSFISKASVKQVPLIGVIAASMQCIFTEREAAGGESSAKKVLGHVARRLTAPATCRPLWAFPEGTTTNNLYLLPFKTGAFLSGVPVQPVVLRYGTSPFSPAFETIHVARSLFLVLSQPRISVTVTYLPLCVPTDAERANPAAFAERVRGIMLETGAEWGLQASSLTLADKREYHAQLLKQWEEWRSSTETK
jgi:lysophosphatidylcholine acyltransferase/lyso-PAF acetyltransferase